MQQEQCLMAVARCSLFSGLTGAEQRKVCGIARPLAAAARTAVFMEGEPAQGMYLVVAGAVRIYKTGPDGREQDIRTVRPGAVFAEAAVFDGATYPAYAETLRDSLLMFIERGRLLALLKKDPEISLKMMATLSRRLRGMVGMVEDLSLKDVGARLAKYLLDESLRQATDCVALPVTKSALAQRLGTVPETLSRTLKKFTRQGLVIVDGKLIRIKEPGSLRKVSAGITE